MQIATKNEMNYRFFFFFAGPATNAGGAWVVLNDKWLNCELHGDTTLKSFAECLSQDSPMTSKKVFSTSSTAPDWHHTLFITVKMNNITMIRTVWNFFVP